ncbi:Lpp/OprI family alanine-zipper lipoprotein [Vibrio astriarenae]|uniref:Major outer membrane lipoprotein Lpp n=1 Tax=Vibrio agarivorans TaxID=153622 RepID=A0ABT7Y727_9VIBR|nr:Lpp/OprI family alanine-zipper lipoprotein [Vibrio agarivorans]MDN2483796.1 Lpp/OprI family alanine-zipper lipoprotein [Vibrio agarivorans]
MNKMLIAAAASSVLLLAGCASGPDEETTAQLNELNAQVSQLSQEVSSLKSMHNADVQKATDAAMSAQEEAARANERIDNIAQSYTK